jgi:nucleotide-binding universal stress UspA family protein
VLEPCQTGFVASVFHGIVFDEGSERSFVHALAIALVEQASLTLFRREGGSHADNRRFQAVRKTLERWELLEPGSDRTAVRDQLSIAVQKLRVGGDPARSCLEAIGEKSPDLVVLATRRRSGIGRWRRPSTAARIGHGSQAPVLYVPSEGRGFVDPNDGHLTLRRILMPIDEASDFDDELVWAKWIAEALGDSPVLLQILREDGPPIRPEERESKDWSIEEISRRGQLLEQTLEAASEADLIVHSARESPPGIFLNSLLYHAPCPVLVIPSASA